MIKLSNISFAYEQNKILDNFSLNFKDHQISCLVGPSGAGKTTLLNIIAGTLKVQQGTIEGVPKKISYLFQDDRLINEITVYKNLELVLLSVYKEKQEIDREIRKYLNLVGLNDYVNYYPHELSGSMRTRLSLVRAFIYPSDLLIMDEPFQGLDIQLKFELLKSFGQLWAEKKPTILYVTHDLDIVSMLSQDIFILTNKPIKIKNQLSIKSEISKRKPYDKASTSIRDKIYKEIEKWKPTTV
ncbi:MAG: ABC transporter ATP-binding protein [Mycoplasmataceae bacterium]|nr:ABC transporter ATP-binding protein [Mycoplasmataceae bacterium]